MSFVVHRVAKSAARYTDAGGREKCAYCRFFVAPRSCGKVIGPVSPAGWCKYFSRQVAQQYSGAGISGGGPSLPPGVTLDLNFMNPGTLDPRITFTRASGAAYIDASGFIQMAATNAPRWDYDPVTHALKGVLIEEQRTNTAHPSIPDMTWSISNITFAPGSGIAPDGTNALTKQINTTANSFHGAQFAWNPPANTTYTISVYAKAAEIRYLQIIFDDLTAFAVWTAFDLQTGTIFPGQGLPASFMIPVGNGIYRCGLTAQISSNPVARIAFNNCNTSSPEFFGPTYAGTGTDGLLLWGAQVEQGAFPTSYIPTTSAAVTRAADQLSCSKTGWYVPPGGSWMAEFIRFNPSVGLYRIIQVDAGSGATQLYCDASTGGIGQYDGGPIQTDIVNTGVNVIARAASTWAVGEAKICANGNAVNKMTGYINGYPSMNPEVIFQTAIPAESMSGYIRALKYWNRILSDTEMQQVTT